MMYFSHDLVQSTALLASVTGAAVFISSVVVFLSGLGFYAFASGREGHGVDYRHRRPC
jgi:hypothetical protein